MVLPFEAGFQSEVQNSIPASLDRFREMRILEIRQEFRVACLLKVGEELLPG